jgi:glycosyltransferase involved in cell wall biosynthesis
MWSGVPVVATKVGAISEIIEYDDLALPESIVDAARRRVRTLFSEARMLSEIDKIYHEVATL